jgi:hypothetical protein
MASDYYRRHFANNKIYCGIDRNGKTSKVVWAYTKAEAMKELRKMGFKPVKVFET